MTTPHHFRLAKQRAKELGIDLYRSDDARHKYMFARPDGFIVRFGAVGYDDYLSHRDEQRRDNYRRRHAGILDGSGRPAYRVKYTPAWASWHILW